MVPKVSVLYVTSNKQILSPLSTLRINKSELYEKSIEINKE